MANAAGRRAVLKPTMQVIRLDYVGVGFMAQNAHLPNFASLSGCRLVTLAEKRPALVQQVARRFDIPKVYHHHQLEDDAEIDGARHGLALGAKTPPKADWSSRNHGFCIAWRMRPC
jgi:hypothetical protein